MNYNILGYLDDDADTALVRLCDIPEAALSTVMAAAVKAHPYCRYWCASEAADDDADEAPR